MSSDCSKPMFCYVTLHIYLILFQKPSFTADIPPPTASIVPMLKWSMEMRSDRGKTYVLICHTLYQSHIISKTVVYRRYTAANRQYRPNVKMEYGNEIRPG